MDNKALVPRGRILSAMFLVAGTCIGGGMLALPVATGIAGFVPSLFTMAICWLAMTITALLLVEVSLWMEEGVHVISMTTRLLGAPGKVVSWVLFLFISYASLVAYTAGGGSQIALSTHLITGIQISKHWGAILFLFVFGAIVYCGSKVVGRVNAILFIGMIVAYLGLVGAGLPEVRSELLTFKSWSASFLAIPLLLASFSFQTMVPSLTPYLNRNVKALRIAILGGTIIAFIIYAIWQMLLLGIVPVEGPNGLAEALKKGEPVTQFLRQHVACSWVCSIADFFAFFAIVTSFLGIALGLFDFLADGLKIKKTGKGNIILGLLIVVPTLIFATQFERIFLVALDTSGGFGDTILNGCIPVLMVWIGRYHYGWGGRLGFMDNKILLSGIFCFFFLCLILEIILQIGYTPQTFPTLDIMEN